jgi:hypothetical protein
LGVTYVSIVGPRTPYCCYDASGAGEFPLMAQLLRNVAGRVGESAGAFAMPPTWHSLGQYVERARACQTGTCDDCSAAHLLVAEVGDQPDKTLIETWLGAIRICTALFAHDEWRGALLTSASQLQDRGVLWGPAVSAIAAGYQVYEAREEVLNELDLWTLLPVVRVCRDALELSDRRTPGRAALTPAKPPGTFKSENK